MNHPNSHKVYELAEIFQNLDEFLKAENVEVNMAYTDFHPCGSIACHAGWFAISQGKSRETTYMFTHAADELGKFLDFENSKDLRIWAHKNPLIWGNGYGFIMFCSRLAFVRKSGISLKLTLKDISNHWYGVANRLALLEDQHEKRRA